MLIGGERVSSASGRTYEVCNPATGEVVQSVPLGTAQDVEQAVQAAEQAFGTWAETSAEDRGVALANACELIKDHAAEIAQLLTAEQGKTLFEANLEIHHLVHGLEFYAGLASKVRGSYVPLPQKGAYGLVLRQPLGVCGAIVPWNFPLTLMGTKVGPALAAGNTIIVKPASTTPLATLRTAELIQQATYAGGKGRLPAGAINVVTGSGAEVGEELLRHPRVRRIAFTGSTEAGRQRSDDRVRRRRCRHGRQNGRHRPLLQLRPDVPGRQTSVRSRVGVRAVRGPAARDSREENRRTRHRQGQPHGAAAPSLPAPGDRGAGGRCAHARR